ncbi:MAG TPA: sensor histidine kinase, partial [Candidatus Caenarcaniphilales bacterium]
HQHLIQAQQQDTLADLLHQFRNPLSTLRILGKLLLKRLESGDANHQVANSILKESDRLQDLLQQFEAALDRGEVALDEAANVSLNLQPASLKAEQEQTALQFTKLLPPSRLQLGSELTLEPCWIDQVLEPLLTSATAVAWERHLSMHTYIPAGLPPVQANAPALREVFSNLIDNALKYTTAGGHIWIQVTQEQFQSVNYQVVAVSDTGPGIPPADLDHVFERHYRGVQAQGEIPGTGLGMAIAQELVKQMHGTLQVLSPAQVNRSPSQASLGPGSTFRVRLLESKQP